MWRWLERLKWSRGRLLRLERRVDGFEAWSRSEHPDEPPSPDVVLLCKHSREVKRVYVGEVKPVGVVDDGVRYDWSGTSDITVHRPGIITWHYILGTTPSGVPRGPKLVAYKAKSCPRDCSGGVVKVSR